MGHMAGLDWTRALYVDTILYFLSLVTFVFLLSRFVISYLSLGKWMSRILSWYGYAIMAFNIALLTANLFTNCFFYFDENGTYLIGDKRYLAFSFQIVFNILIALFVFIKAITSRDSVRRRSMMVFMFCTTIAVAIALQVLWPLTPFTALGCLISNCFFHVFVVQDERTAKHMAELEKALARAQEAEKARSMFFSIVSHDIRTPLNAILGYCELLRFGIKRKSQRDEALDAIRASGTTLLELVNDVLYLSKMDAGKMTLHPEPVRLSQLTEEVFASLRMTAADKGVELVDRTSDVPTVIVDEHRFRQVLVNLVGNAVKFTSHGSVTVAASYKDKTLTVSVIDTGCGIPPDMLAKIFDPFVQVQDPSHSADRAGGTGLGLHICRLLARAMGGELKIASELGKGATFSVVIPGVKVAKVSSGQTQNIAPVTPAKRDFRLLVADDTKLNQLVLKTMFGKLGVTNITFANDGCEALDILEAKGADAFDFVLTDAWMPEMTGMDLVAAIRANPALKGLKVYLFTAEVEMRETYAEKGFDGLLLKPATLESLRRLLP